MIKKINNINETDIETKPNEMCDETNNDIIVYNTVQVSKILGCSIPTARAIMCSKGFPLVRVGKNLKVYKNALENWLSAGNTHIGFNAYGK